MLTSDDVRAIFYDNTIDETRDERDAWLLTEHLLTHLCDAIAERMKEGMVWQEGMVVQEEFQRAQESSTEEGFYYSVVGPSGEIALGADVDLPIVLHDGQLVEAMVRVKEK